MRLLQLIGVLFLNFAIAEKTLKCLSRNAGISNLIQNS